MIERDGVEFIEHTDTQKLSEHADKISSTKIDEKTTVVVDVEHCHDDDLQLQFHHDDATSSNVNSSNSPSSRHLENGLSKDEQMDDLLYSSDQELEMLLAGILAQERRESKEVVPATKNEAETWFQKLFASQMNQIIFRDAIQLLVCFALCFVKQVQEIGGEETGILFVYALISTLRSFSESAIGNVIDQFLWYSLMAVSAMVYTLFVAAAMPHSIGGFLVIYFLIVLVFFYWGTSFPQTRLPVALFLNIVASMFTVTFITFNYDTSVAGNVDAQWEAMIQSCGRVLSMALISLGVFLFVGLTVFPWTGTKVYMNNFMSFFDLQKVSLLAAQLHWSKVVTSGLAESERMGAAPYFGNMEGKVYHHYKVCMARSVTMIKEQRFCFSGRGMEMYSNLKNVRGVARIFRMCGIHLQSVAKLEGTNQASVDMLLKRDKLDPIIKSLDNYIAHVSTVFDVCKVLFTTETWTLMKQQEHFVPQHRQDLAEWWRRAELLRADVRKATYDWMPSWNEMLDDSDEVQTCISCVMIHVRMIIRLAEAYKETYENKLEELEKEKWKSWSYRFQDWAFSVLFLTNWELTKYREGPLTGMMHIELKWYQRLFRKWSFLFQSNAFKNAFKAAICSVCLLVFSFLPQTWLYFQTTSMANALSGLFIVFRQVQVGLLGERFGQMMIGYLISYCWVGISYTISCACGGCTTFIDGWLLFVFGLPTIFMYFYGKIKQPTWSYSLYTFAKEYCVIQIILITERGPEANYSTAWEVGGFTTINALLGSTFAVFVGSFLFPITAVSTIRDELSVCYEIFVFLAESYFYVKHVDEKQPELESRVRDLENYLSAVIHQNIPVFVRVSKLERLHLRQTIQHDDIVAMVSASKDVWGTLWAFHHLLFEKVYKDDDKPVLMAHLRHFEMAICRSLAVACYMISSSLRPANYLRVAPPVMRPDLVNPVALHDSLALRIQRVRKAIPSPQDDSPRLRGEIFLFRYILLSLAKQVGTMYTTLFGMMLKQPYYEALSSMREQYQQDFLNHFIKKMD